MFSDNAFSGVDRVSDGHQITAGVTTRCSTRPAASRPLRLGLAQRYLFRDLETTPDGIPLTQKLFRPAAAGSANVSQTLDPRRCAAIQPRDQPHDAIGDQRAYSPEPMHTLAASYRLARAGSEYLDAGWQWPVYRGSTAAGASTGSSVCQGTLYSVGRANYSMRDSRVTDSLVGFEYDSGCWIARVVGERVSTGRTEATTRLLLQLELARLSRLGSNPLQVLKDNIPGYQLLRDDQSDPPPRVYTPSPRRQ